MNLNKNLPPVITIDGPGGTGKGTLSHKLAKYLGWHFLDSGSLYRLLAYAATQAKVDLGNEAELAELAKHLDIKFVGEETDGPIKVFLSGNEVTQAIRSEDCGSMASKISAFVLVREALLSKQRAFRQPPGLVTDGRDMGTIIFPDAVLKIFLEASFEERVKRRLKQLKQQGINVSLHQISHDLEKRDARDQTRQVAPLKPASDAVIIDTTHLSVQQTFERVLEEVKRIFPL